MSGNYDYLEIGASCFKTMAESFKDRPEVRGISIEPISEYLDELKYSMGECINENKIFLNVAIDEQDNIKDFYYFDYYEFSKTSKSNLGLSGVGSFDRSNVEFEVRIQLGEDYFNFIKQRKIPCMRINQLIEEYCIESVDILKIDAEGYDGVILESMMKTTKLKPKIIIYENLIIGRSSIDGPEILKRLNEFLKGCGYYIASYDKFNTICMKLDDFLEIKSLDLNVPANSSGSSAFRERLKQRERSFFNKSELIERMHSR